MKMTQDRDDKSVATQAAACPGRRGHAVLLLAALAVAPFAARAQIYKCAQANGTTSFQSTPCPTGSKPPAHPTAAQLNAQRPVTKDEKPYDDPYANGTGSRPREQAADVQAPTSSNDAPPAPAAPATKTSNLVAEVQARNRRENEQQAYQDAHRNDKSVNMAACNSARRNLGILSEQHPVFTYDNQGNRVYVEDKDRASRIAEAQRAVSANCP
jgi:hypothetical protein